MYTYTRSIVSCFVKPVPIDLEYTYTRSIVSCFVKPVPIYIASNVVYTNGSSV